MNERSADAIDLSPGEAGMGRVRAVSPELETNLGELRLVASGIAHDFNNALTVILGNAAILERELPGGSPERARVQRILGSARSASEMAEGLVSVASREVTKRAPLELSRWLDEIAPHLTRVVGDSVDLAIETTAALPPISADSVQLERLTTCLLANTRDALGAEGGRAWVRSGLASLAASDHGRFFPSGPAPRGLCVYLEVENDGPKLGDAARARLFEPFFTTRPGALGLGLTAVLRIAKQHRAAIEVESDPGHSGSGVRFRVWFPVLAGN